ncbi:transglycosylase domain-containing protein [Kordiimonas marina]|uniref:transglycosylase domain-containing protein n=1 Tax=Kordiimonas marina TaxID=2872312 RepID=UPI001FF2B582|nr:transglycosylase domain-containing protein [Kordiimonas marina]MCJ9430637.1 transglycosylase domain-containing protein [Kordiimonas marina]
MRKTKTVGLIALLALVSFGVYAAAIVIPARTATPDLVARAFAESPERIEPGELPARWVEALIKVDDPNFYRHGGTDFSHGIMTTIPQALTKQLYFHPFKPGLAKIRQSLIARFALDASMPKNVLLSLFLSHAYLGEGPKGPVYGFGAGARVYYGKPLKELSDDQFLGLVAMLTAPNIFNPLTAPEAHAHQLARVKKLLAVSAKAGG